MATRKKAEGTLRKQVLAAIRARREGSNSDLVRSVLSHLERDVQAMTEEPTRDAPEQD